MRLYQVITEKRIAYITSRSTVEALQFYCRFYATDFMTLNPLTAVRRVVARDLKNIYFEEKDDDGIITRVTAVDVLKLKEPHLVKSEKNDGSVPLWNPISINQRNEK